MKTLKLFNSVLVKEVKTPMGVYPVFTKEGIFIPQEASHKATEIEQYYLKQRINGEALNKTFHKSWSVIAESSRFTLLLEQIKHYLSTYGSNFKDEVYIPDEVLNVPDLKMVFKTVRAYTKEEMTEKCISMLDSGIALERETIDDLISILSEELGYDMAELCNVKNKEAQVIISEVYGIYPYNPSEFLRFLIYKSTGQTLMVKSDEFIQAVKDSLFNPSMHIRRYDLEKLATIFNRFKPIFLAYKKKCPKLINKISKLSKKHHKPLVENPLNKVTNRLLTKEDNHWLLNATPFALFKALTACYNRKNGQDTFLYKIRNGKSFVKKEESVSVDLNKANYKYLMEYIKTRFDFTSKSVYIPDFVKFALPTSEKLYVGNFPTGTRFYGKKLTAGIYWENSWGAIDLDLSGLNIAGKVGWNSSFNQGSGDLMYSGDMTDARYGAVEYLRANRGLLYPTLIMNNVYNGNHDCDYKIILGHGEKVSKEYMMDPNNLLVEAKTQSVQKSTILGMMIPKKDEQCFVILNFGAGSAKVSGNGEISDLATKALYQEYSKAMSLNKVLKKLGATMVDSPEKADYDLSLSKLEKDTFIKMFV